MIDTAQADRTLRRNEKIGGVYKVVNQANEVEAQGLTWLEAYKLVMQDFEQGIDNLRMVRTGVEHDYN